ncbi:MAG: FAD:protein FMN transferase [Deltaproteobacteria bacterium]|nr:FAD:protein FMN transferase [Deltaproteobacteria bacterium]
MLLCGTAAPAVADQVYLSAAEAPRAVFPEADRFARRQVASTAELRERVAQRLGSLKPSVWEQGYEVATAFAGDRRLGRAVEVEEIGKHRAITLVIGVDPQGRVAGVAVMVYREAYGGEIRSRRFLDQYRGKGEGDPLLPSRDIQNITGATLSARAVGRAVKKAIAVLEVLGDTATEPDPQPPSPAAAQRGEGHVARVREAHYVMGTMLEITLEASSEEAGRAWIRRAVAESRRLDAELSSFRSDSALSELNRRAGAGPQRVPRDLFRVVERSTQLSAASAGTFDVTVSPLLRMWRRAARDGRWPSAAEIAAARRLVGFERIRLRPPDEIELAGRTSLELGGIGKGYAVDRMVEVLRRSGARSALVNFGGSSIAALGPPAGESGWPVWVRRGSALDGPLVLRDMALSTSGSLGKVERVAGRPIGHIVDPRTGRALERSAQATVLAPTATEAEAWSKALLVDPALARRAMAARPSVSALVFEGS